MLQSAVDRLRSAVGGTGPVEERQHVKRATLERPLVARRKRGGRPVRTIPRQTSTWAIEEDLISARYSVANIQMLRHAPTSPDTIAAQDIPELLHVADSGPWYISDGVRMMLGNRLCIGELLGLRAQDFHDPDGGDPVVFVCVCD